MTLADVERYLTAHRLDLRVRFNAARRRWEASLFTWNAVDGPWEMDANDLAGAVSSAIEAHRVHTPTRRS